MIRGRSRRR